MQVGGGPALSKRTLAVAKEALAELVAVAGFWGLIYVQGLRDPKP